MNVLRQGERAVGFMNAAVTLLMVFAMLFVFVVLSAMLDAQTHRAAKEPAQQEASVTPQFSTSPTTVHDQPPIIVLSEAAGYSFATGQADVSPEFQRALREQIIPQLGQLGSQYRCDIIDCIGHTDEQAVSGKSNLDTALLAHIQGEKLVFLTAGSNADLALLRCLEVTTFLRTEGLPQFTFYNYSAAQTVLPSGEVARPGQTSRNDPTRRRIELRLRRAPGVG